MVHFIIITEVKCPLTESDESNEIVLWYTTYRIFVVFKEVVTRPLTLQVLIPRPSKPQTAPG